MQADVKPEKQTKLIFVKLWGLVEPADIISKSV